ncbi:MAG: hypothetical protein AAGF86_16200 [Pseudomonadota bacterium]
MLEAAVIAMTVMGCNHQSEDCQIIAQPPKVWESQSACDAAIPGVIEGSLQAPYPVIVARCAAKADSTQVKIGTPKPEIQIVELPAPAPTPQAEAEAEKSDETKLPPIAKLAVQKTTEGWTFVRKGANAGVDRVKTGVKGAVDGVKGVVGGVKSVVGDAVDLAERGADAVRDVLVPKE